MCEAPGSVVTLLCSGIQLYSAERRIADCILADVKRASMCTSAELARLSCSSEATITRLCHKLGFENYRKFQLRWHGTPWSSRKPSVCGTKGRTSCIRHF